MILGVFGLCRFVVLCQATQPWSWDSIPRLFFIFHVKSRAYAAIFGPKKCRFRRSRRRSVGPSGRATVAWLANGHATDHQPPSAQLLRCHTPPSRASCAHVRYWPVENPIIQQGWLIAIIMHGLHTERKRNEHGSELATKRLAEIASGRWNQAPPPYMRHARVFAFH